MKSAIIVPFPPHKHTTSTAFISAEMVLKTGKAAKQVSKMTGLKSLLNGPLGLLWLLLGLLWPLLQWLGAMDVLFQCARALYYSNIPSVHATLQAGIHMGGYLLIALFVYLYRPKVY
jgi:hypothetical protein